MRIPIRRSHGEPAFGRCDPPERRPYPVSPVRGTSLASLIPAEWVGLAEDAARAPSSLPRGSRGGGPAPASQGFSSPVTSLSVIASVAPAAAEHVTPVTPYLDRGMCFVEPGKPCRSSGRCRQRGY
jgi:hypothetical protein